MAVPLAAAAANLAKKEAGRQVAKHAPKILGMVAGGAVLIAGALGSQVSGAIARSQAQNAAQGVLKYPAPAKVRAAATRASELSGVPVNILLAVAYKETSYGSLHQPSAGALADTIPQDIAATIQGARLAPGGEVSDVVGRPAGQGVSLEDWVNAVPVGSEHALGFMQFLPSTWRGHASGGTAVLGHVPDPYEPSDAMTMAGLKISADRPHNLLGVAATLAALDAYGGRGYGQQILDIAGFTTFTPGNPLACRTATATQGFGAVSLGFEPPRGSTPHFHTGFDLSCGYGTQVLSLTDGVARVHPDPYPGQLRGWGNVVSVEVGGVHVRYCHLALIAISDGQVVHAGDLLGLEGSTGASTGSHLHLELDQGRDTGGGDDYRDAVSPAGLVDPRLVRISPGAEGAFWGR